MRSKAFWSVPAVLALIAASSAQAQIYPGGNNRPGDRTPGDTGKAFQFSIKRRTVSGVVKSLDGERKTLVVESGKDNSAKETPIDVGPSLIKAGKGSATFTDIQVGDKITVYGESTVQGGLRAMEITLPKERMSIGPPVKPKKVKLTKEEKEAAKKADEEARAAKKAEEREKKAAKKAEEEEKRAAKKAEADEAKKPETPEEPKKEN